MSPRFKSSFPLRVLVTGASRGLGREISLALAKSGHSVTGIARSSAELESLETELQSVSTSSGVKICDLLDSNATSGLIDLMDFDIDAVVHNLGGTIKTHDNLVRSEDLSSALNFNLLSAVALNEMVLPKMISRGTGKLIHISSLSSIENYGSNIYAISKSALNAYVRVMGRQFFGSGITITGLIPGKLLESRLEADATDKDDISSLEIVEILEFLLGMRSCAFSGTLLQIDGGRSAVIERFLG